MKTRLETNLSSHLICIFRLSAGVRITQADEDQGLGDPSKHLVHMYSCLNVGSRIKPSDEDQVGDLIYLTQKMCIPAQVFGLGLPFLVKTRFRINLTDHLVFPFSCFPVF